MIEIKHITDAEDPRDNGFYWYDTQSDCDLFGPFSSQDLAAHAADYDIEDDRTLYYFDADTRDFKSMRLRFQLSRFSAVDAVTYVVQALTDPKPGALCSRGGTIRGLSRCTRRCPRCIAIQGVKNPHGRVLPTGAFHCVGCGSFNVRVRHQLNADTQRWYHPNKGWDGFSGIPGKDSLESRCGDCGGDDWDFIEEGHDWWNDFREWFSGRSKY